MTDGGAPAVPDERRVLLVDSPAGPRAAPLARLAVALRAGGRGAEITRDAGAVDAAELRAYGAVVFAPGTGEAERAQVRAACAAAGCGAVFVEDPAPLPPVLLAQVEQALWRGPVDGLRLARLTVVGGQARLEVTEACRVRVTGYRPGPLGRVRARELFDGRVGPGGRRVGVPVPWGMYVVARCGAEVLVARVSPQGAPPHRTG
ncbi:hypothetical protein [Streptomyces hesseae]|uniref:Uncharacterized protein n=1 Tax=Streptomyces hesseae TaxID=3075519 RepID=A0ABU2SJL9_9ACTN|nr:hypothetical protein [Streptomyces sp. DSM 40473]MDT0449166.1 hypothetical protein [Streptomyces sp. DSM 40473]